LNPEFTGVEKQGWMVVSVIYINIAVNALFSISLMISKFYDSVKKNAKYKGSRTSLRVREVQNISNSNSISAQIDIINSSQKVTLEIIRKKALRTKRQTFQFDD